MLLPATTPTLAVAPDSSQQPLLLLPTISNHHQCPWSGPGLHPLYTSESAQPGNMTGWFFPESPLWLELCVPLPRLRTGPRSQDEHWLRDYNIN